MTHYFQAWVKSHPSDLCDFEADDVQTLLNDIADKYYNPLSDNRHPPELRAIALVGGAPGVKLPDIAEVNRKIADDWGYTNECAIAQLDYERGK